jgi:hypothetical protein
MMAEGIAVLLCHGPVVLCPRRHPMARQKRGLLSVCSLRAGCTVSQTKPVQVYATEIMLWDK